MRPLWTAGTSLRNLPWHYLEEAEHCDRLAILDRRRVVTHGTPAALKAAIGDDHARVRTTDDAAAAVVLRENLALRPATGPDGLTTAVATGARQTPGCAPP